METETKEITLIDNIKNLWPEISHKTSFIELVAEDLDKAPSTLRQHWFSNTGFWSVPEEYQARVVELMQNRIKNQ